MSHQAQDNIASIRQSQQPLKLTSTPLFHLCLVLRSPQHPGLNAEESKKIQLLVWEAKGTGDSQDGRAGERSGS